MGNPTRWLLTTLVHECQPALVHWTREPDGSTRLRARSRTDLPGLLGHVRARGLPLEPAGRYSAEACLTSGEHIRLVASITLADAAAATANLAVAGPTVTPGAVLDLLHDGPLGAGIAPTDATAAVLATLLRDAVTGLHTPSMGEPRSAIDLALGTLQACPDLLAGARLLAN